MGKGHGYNRLIHYRKSTETLWILLSGSCFLVVHMVSAFSTLASFLISSNPTNCVTLKPFSFTVSLHWSDKAGKLRKALE